MKISKTIIFIIVALLPSFVFADDPHGTVRTVYVSSTSIYNTIGVTEKQFEGAIAMSLASKPSFSGISTQWQGGAGVALYGNAGAMSLDFGKKACDKCPLITGGLSTDFDHVGGYMYFNWKFDHGRR